MKEKRKMYYGWVIVALCFMLMGVGFVSYYGLNNQFLVIVTKDMGFSRTTFSLFNTVGGLCLLLCGPFAGGLITKRPKLFILLGIVLIGTSFFLNAAAQSATLFFIASCMRAIGTAFSANVAVSVLVNNWFGPKKSGTALGIAMMGSSVGTFILKWICDKFILGFGWRVAYAAMGGIVLVILIPAVLFMLVDSPEEKGLQKMGVLDGDIKTEGLSLKEAVKTPAFFFIVFALIALGMANGSINSHAHAYFRGLGYSQNNATTIVSLAALLAVSGKLIVGWICDKKGAMASIIFACSTFMLTFASLILADKIMTPAVILYVAFFALGSALGLLAPAYMTNKLFGNMSFGIIVGIFTLSTGLGTAIGDPITGKIFDTTGSYTLAWIIMIAVLAVSLILFAIANRIGPKWRETVVKQ
jgi:sugar phosphate permease